MSNRASGRQRWVLKPGLNHANSRIRGPGLDWCLDRGEIVKSRIGEAQVDA